MHIFLELECAVFKKSGPDVKSGIWMEVMSVPTSSNKDSLGKRFTMRLTAFFRNMLFNSLHHGFKLISFVFLVIGTRHWKNKPLAVLSSRWLVTLNVVGNEYKKWSRPNITFLSTKRHFDMLQLYLWRATVAFVSAQMVHVLHTLLHYVSILSKFLTVYCWKQHIDRI